MSQKASFDKKSKAFYLAAYQTYKQAQLTLSS